ncbi:MAG TPA: pectin acetylesterase-family hydrolase [Meiothermus sp.]|nr:pectin acetylesterase-family hydrolase [Meiothermus sp.]
MKRLLFSLLFGFLLLGLAQSSSRVPPGWLEIPGPEGTMCSDGSPWKFYVSPGAANKVVLDFQGGGACWNEGNCNPQTATYTRAVQANELFLAQGIYNRLSTANPFYGWTHVFVPYCTADIHWGNATVQYGQTTIQHKGALNAKAALDWLFANRQSPDTVFVTGCSAGAYGSVMWAPYVMRQYPTAKVIQLGDAGVGVVNDAFANTGFKNWKAEGALPDWIPDLAAARSEASKIRLPAIYAAVAKAYPKNVLAQYTTAQDNTQIFFYGLMKGEPQPSQATAVEWVQGAIGNLAAIKQASPNFFSFVAPGGQHCVIPRPEFYTLKVGDTTLLEWVNKLVKTGNPGDVAPPR